MKKREFKQLSYEERVVICHLLRQGHSAADIARQLKRTKSTISRELKRNRLTSGSYYPLMADNKRKTRRMRRRLLIDNEALRLEVVKRLKKTHSPEQIAGALALAKGGKVISYETIYRFIYSDLGKELKLWQHLRFNKRTFRQQRGIRRSKVRIPNRVSIHARPSAVNHRQVFGHWKCDLLHFKRNVQANVLVLRERLTRYTLTAVNSSKSAEPIAEQIIRLLSHLPPQARQSITYDNGLEFAAHEQVKQTLEAQTYFCDPYKSYQKGAVEQVNLWLRERLPRTLSQEEVTHETVAGWVDLINNRPLKCLGYQTPAHCFANPLRSDAHA